ncbi:MAG: prepilin peptidase [Rubripirellula sp.]
MTAVISAIAAYVFGLSWWQALHHSFYEPDDLWIPRSIDVVVAIWSFWVGSSVGSFLNVVAWRMPRGEGVNGRSYCPRCKNRLRARDNFPVFGWLALGGRCRTCRLPISPRYPIVEAAVGTSLTLISIGQLYQLSLPGQPGHSHGGPLWAPIIDGPVLVTLLFHVFAVAFAWAMGLIRLDRNRLPNRLVFTGLGTIVIAMLAFPLLMIVPWQNGPTTAETWMGLSLYANAGVRVLTSLAAAALISRSLARAFCPSADPKADPLGNSTRRLIDVIAIVAVPSLIVGWQSVPAVTVIATLIAIPIRRIFRSPKRIGTDGLGAFALAMPIALTMQLIAWRWLLVQPWWPSGFNGGPWTILAWAAAILVVPVWLRDPEITQPNPRPDSDLDLAEDDEDDEDEECDDEAEPENEDGEPSDRIHRDSNEPQ